MYKVNIDFKDGMSFGCEVVAATIANAKELAIKNARACGFNSAVKTVKAWVA